MTVDPELQGLSSARDLLLGREVSAVCFVRDYVELHLDGPIVRALSNPFGLYGCSAWKFPEGHAAERLLGYIGRVVDGFDLFPDAYAQLSFGEHSFNVPLDDAQRVGPEALHIVGVDEDGSTDATQMWIW